MLITIPGVDKIIPSLGELRHDYCTEALVYWLHYGLSNVLFFIELDDTENVNIQIVS